MATTSKKSTTTTAKKTSQKKSETKKVDEMVNSESSLFDVLLPSPSTTKTKTTPKKTTDKKTTTTKTTSAKKSSTDNKKTTTKKSSNNTKKTTKKEVNQTALDAKKNEKKLKSMTKDDKAMYKKLWEHFNYVANLTMVIEERMMDTKLIPDLTIGEMHVLETVDRLNGKPMTKIANALKVTVGSLTIGVNRLVAKEYLLRIRDEDDHRVVNLSVTPKAKKVLKIHDKFHEDILLGVLDGITLRDATKVMAQFNRVLENYINPKERVYASSSKKPTK